MPRPLNLQKSLDRLVAYLGAEIAKAVAERVGKKLTPGKTADRKRRGGKAKADQTPGRKNKKSRKKPRKCSIRGCKNPARSKGLCSKHYQKARYAALHGKKAARKAKKARGAIRPRKKAIVPTSPQKSANA